MKTLSSLSQRLLDGLFPPTCQLCGACGTLLCPPCLEAARTPLRNICRLCALPLHAVDAPAGTACGACLRHPPFYDATQAALCYAAPVDQLIVDLKYRARLALGPLFASLLAHDLQHAGSRGMDFDVLIPVPLHRARLTQRGFNQALEIARALGRILDKPVLPDAVLRVRDTAAQASLPFDARLDNMRSAFHIRGLVAGQRIAIVDDVMTTGATLNELARTLKNAGARVVVNLVVARTLPASDRRSAQASLAGNIVG